MRSWNTGYGTAGSTQGGARLSSFLIHSGTLVCMDAAGRVLRGDLLARDGVITALGPDADGALGALPGGRAAQSYDAS